MEKNYNLIDSAGRSSLELLPIIASRTKQMEGNPDVYWSCDGNPVWTKYQAMKNLTAGQATHFYCFDQQWAAADWTKPTKVDLYDLSIERARQIRRDNDFVRITYSGGADSHTVLNAFRAAEVAPDEIVFFTWLYGLNSFFNSNFEIDSAVIPYISTIQSWFPKTKIRHLNIDLELLYAFRSLHPDNFGFELGTGIRSIGSAGVVALFDQLTTPPGSVTVTGSDKPRLDYINGNWYMWTTDVSSTHLWGKNVQGFFQSADPTIFIKQCHSMKNYLISQIPVIDRRSVLDIQASKADKETRKNINLCLKRNLPFDDSASSRKISSRPAPGIGEGHSKAVIMYRAIQKMPGGKEFLENWEQTKQQFKTETGYCASVNVFSKFYNLDTGEVCTVDELFPNGWHNK